ncbi:hypothetical protein ACLVWU_08585 [Bdellovibrio sp. HCB290]|uniref:hypothetical protein n=1 Tax=Bdellovibrio sp. HCB290 TaxID=3394356 RepID=UPI0039B56E46
MRSLYGPKVFYKSYAAYISKSVGWGKFCLVLALPVLSISVFVGLSFLASKTPEAHSSNLDFFAKMCIFMYVLGVLLIIFARNQYFEVKEDRIIDFFPRKKEYKIQQIEKVNLDNPHRAGIIIKLPGERLSSGLFWCGANENDWKDFVNTLAAVDPSVLSKIQYNRNKWKTPEYSRVSFDESYKKILEVYK